MKCRYCNNSLEPNAKFCNKCGREIDRSKDESASDILKQLDAAAEALEKSMNESENEIQNEIHDEPATMEIPVEKAESVPVTEKAETTPEPPTRTAKVSDRPVTETTAVKETSPADTVPDNSISENINYINSDLPLDTLPVKVGAGRLFGAWWVGLLAFIILILISLMCCLKLGVSGNTVKNCINRADIVQFADSKVKDDTSVSDYLYELTDFYAVSGNTATKSEFRDFLTKSDFMNFVNDKTDSYINYIINGKGNEPTVSTNEMIEFIQQNPTAQKEAFGAQLVKDEYNGIRKQLEKKEVSQKLLISSWSSKLGFNLGMTKLFFQYLTLGIIAAVFVLLLIWIAIIVDKRAKHVLGYFGSILMTGGFIVFLVGFTAFLGSPLAYVHTVSLIAYACSELLVPFSLFAMATGAFEFIIGMILRKIRKFIVRKEKELY